PGQATSGGIFGTITDSSGAVVPDAKVTILNRDQNITTEVRTNESGNYTQTQLASGHYRITVEGSGFQPFVQENITVSVGGSSRVDVQLVLSSETQQLTISGAPPALVTDSAEVTTTLSGPQANQIPLLNRNFTNLTLLVPGATLNTYQHSPAENPQQSTLVNTNGQAFAGTNYLLDGMNNNDAVLGIVIVNPPVDSVSETNVLTSNYDAEFTQAGGSVVLVQTKSGANQLHGSLFEYLQNNVTQSRDPLTQGLHDPGTPAPPHRGVPELRYNQFGGSIGGKIITDKLFYFADYQGTLRRIGASQTVRVPTPAERTGNLSSLGVPIYDPSTGNADGSGRSLFTGGIIPPSRISSPATALMNALPLPNLTTTNPSAPNYSASQVEQFDTHQGDVRGDYYASDKLRTFAKYSLLKADVTAPGPFGLYGGPAFAAWGFTGASQALNQSGALSASYNFSPTLLTEARFGVSQYDVTGNPLDINQTLADQIGIPGLNIPGRPDTFGLPDLNINGNGGFSLGYSCNCPLHERELLIDFVNNWTKIKGNHTIKFGANIELATNRRLPSDSHRAGVYDFNPGVTSLGPSATGGLGLASFLLGSPSQFRRFSQISNDQEDRQNRMFYFVQDTWRVTSKLTLSVGVRWDTWFPDYSKNSGQGGRYDVTTNTVLIPGVGGISQSGNSETQWKNIAPRFAIAYALNSKTVVRAGYGRSFFAGTFGWTFNNVAADVYPSVITQFIPTTSPFQPVFPLTTAPPAAVFPVIPANGRLPLPNGINPAYIPPNQKIPSVDQWNVTVERELPSGLNLALAYVGNMGRHLNGGFNLNSAIPGPGANINLRRPLFAQFGLTDPIFDKCDCTSSNYNALQIRGQKRFSSGYSLLASYTFSKSLDFGFIGGLATNQYNARTDYGPSDFNRAHVFTLAHTWDLPFGPGRAYLSDVHGVLRRLVEGWQFSGITTWESGLPFSPTLSNSASLNSDQTTRPDQTGDAFAGTPNNRNQWFNPAVYSVPALYTFGGASRNSLRGPQLFSADWGLSKNFALTERTNLQFRWDVYNSWNNTNLALPNANVDTGNAGQITAITAPMRNMQFGLRLGW
ncbi:MAG TPA: TonB-dependent receptor, partial [Bryobacteraceae bacterium]|nr:TonB-dependent receptor [Bryobacteraceae bacterium]